MIPFSTSSSLHDALGVNTHLSYGPPTKYQDFPLVLRQVKSLGVTRIRDGFHTTVTGQASPNFDMDSVFFPKWVELWRHGIRTSAVLDQSEKLGPITSATLNTLIFESGMAVGQFEGPNEPDLNSPVGWVQTMVAYQNQIAPSVRGLAQGFRGIPLLSPSLAAPLNASRVKWGVPVPFDVLNWHYYPTANQPTFAIAQSIAALKTWGNLPVQVTEFGYNTLDLSELAAAKYTLRGILDLWQAGVQAVYLYELQDEGQDAAENSHWGLVRWDGSVKPAFSGVANLLKLLCATPRPVVTPLACSITSATAWLSSLLLQQSDNEWLLFLWQPVSVWNGKDVVNQPVLAGLTLPPGMTAEVYQPLTQAEPLTIFSAQTQLTLSIPDHPVAVLLKAS